MRSNPSYRRQLLSLMLAMTCLLSACTAEVYHGLEEQSANEMIVALEQQGIEGQKSPDPNNKGAWMLVVPSQSRVQAMSTLKAQGLPRPAPEGFGKFYPSGGLIPTSNEEHVLLQYATAQELRRSLLLVDGVVDAHVNLVMPKKSRVNLSRDPAQKTRASVLVRYRAKADGSSPISEPQIKELFKGGVEELAAEDISVILTAEEHKPLVETKLAQVGPIAVAPKSKIVLQLLIAGLCGAILALSAGVGFLLIRRKGATSAES